MDEIRIDGTTFFDKAICSHSRPAWSPDGKSLVISIEDSSSQGSLYVVSLADTSVTPFLKASGDWNQEIFSSPIYSPDGTRAAYVKWGNAVGEYSEIWIINADGSNPQRLTRDHSDFYPAWSPDGHYIAFTRLIAGRPYIFAVNVRDHSVVQITQKEGEYPVWIK
jgi:TolB protein